MTVVTVPARNVKTILVWPRQLHFCDNVCVVGWVNFHIFWALVFFIISFFHNFIISLFFKLKSGFSSRPIAEDAHEFHTGHALWTACIAVLLVLPLYLCTCFLADLELQQCLLHYFSFGSACHFVFISILVSTSLSSYAYALPKLMDWKGLSINDLFSNCNNPEMWRGEIAFSHSLESC